MDEPLSNLDAKLRTKPEGITQVAQGFSNHDHLRYSRPSGAMTLGDRVAVMMEGTLQQVDSPQMLYLYPANQFVAGLSARLL